MDKADNNTILQLSNIKKYFPIKRGVFKHQVGVIKAVDNISFNVNRGEILGLVGESGCGKTTLGRVIIQLYPATEGNICFEGEDLTKLHGEALRQMRQEIQMIFQDPFASLDPRKTVFKIISEPLENFKIAPKKDRIEKVSELLGLVGLNPSIMNRFPHEFSGGQRQRIGIARALSLNPKFVVCDEPISALDVSIQAQVVNLLKTLQEKLGLTYIFISHDLSMVRYISNRIAVMYLGKIVELDCSKDLFQNPLHPYTQALLSAIPILDSSIQNNVHRIVLEGDLPSAANPPVGCNFSTRCSHKLPICCEVKPDLIEVEPGHYCACHLVKQD